MAAVTSDGDSRMASGYKVRITDGSEIGPMDLAALKTWYSQGLIDKSSPVLKPGSKRWSTLGQVIELKTLGAAPRPSSGGKPAGARTAAGTARPEPRYDEGGEGFDLDTWRVRLAGGTLLLGAGAVGFLALRPENALPDLDGAPWIEIALGLLVLGLALLPGWELARKGVRAAMALLALAIFPVLGILFAQGVRGAGLVAVGAAWLVASGLFAFLAPSLSGMRAALCLLPVLAGAYGAWRFGYAPGGAAEQEVREWATADRRFSDDSLGLAFQAPPGWLILKNENPLVRAPAEARLVVAQPRTGGFGYLVAEAAPRGVGTLDQYLDRLVAARRQAVPSLAERGRSDVLVGRLSGRRAVGAWQDGGVRQQDAIVAWRDGWVYFGLVSWIPEERAQRAQGLEALAAAFSSQGLLADRMQKALQKVTEDVPQLSVPAAEALMGQSEAKVLDPEQAFRRSIDALSRALPGFSRAETQELASLTSATYATLDRKERSRLAAYFDRVRARDTTAPGEDREMCLLMKTAVLKLSAARRLRLQAIYEKAIRSSTQS